MVECNLAKVDVEGSSPFSRSKVSSRFARLGGPTSRQADPNALTLPGARNSVGDHWHCPFTQPPLQQGPELVQGWPFGKQQIDWLKRRPHIVPAPQPGSRPGKRPNDRKARAPRADTFVRRFRCRRTTRTSCRARRRRCCPCRAGRRPGRSTRWGTMVCSVRCCSSLHPDKAGPASRCRCSCLLPDRRPGQWPRSRRSWCTCVAALRRYHRCRRHRRRFLRALRSVPPVPESASSARAARSAGPRAASGGGSAAAAALVVRVRFAPSLQHRKD